VRTATTPECPSDDALHQLAAGLSPDATATDDALATKLLQHAATCDHCGPLLRAFTEDFSDDFTPEEQAALANLKSASAGWQRQTARKMLHEKNTALAVRDSSSKLSHWNAWKWVPAFSFVLLLAAGVTWVYPLLILHKANLAVEAEYRKGRPMKYRPAGVPYGHYKQELGGGIVPISAPIIEVPKPERAPLLASNADFLLGDTSQAKSTLEKAMGKERALPLLNNLAVAYAMEAEDLRPVSEQDKEAQKKVYQKALDITGEILRRSPSDSAGLFNQALILERLGNTKDAITALEQLRQVEQDAGWQEEATEELRRIQPTR
jgi:tetratricopeptide (TPR) repeat protein